jgi:hypothetical protein
MRSFLVGVLVIVAGAAWGQNPLVKVWDKRYGGNSWDDLISFQQTFDAGFILGGTSSSDSSGDVSQHLRGGGDYWMVKTDSTGNKQWDKRFGALGGENLNSIEQTADGGYILGGFTDSDSSGDISQHTRGAYDYWIVKTDALGNKMWDKRFGGNFFDKLYSVQQTFDGGFILGGWTLSENNGDVSQATQDSSSDYNYRGDYWIVKTDSMGNKQWDKRYGGNSQDILYCVQQTSDWGYILGGHIASDSSGDVSQSTKGSSDFWVVKTDSLGNKQWDKRFGGSNFDQFHTVQQCDDKGYILCGLTYSDSSGDVSQHSRGYSDFWMVKIDSTGHKQWDRRYGGSSAEDEFGNTFITSDRGYLISGTSYSPISADKTENNLGYEQTWIVKTDSMGIKQWDKTIFTTGHDESGICLQTKDGCYLFGNSTSADTGGYKTEFSRGFEDFWIVKFCDPTFSTSAAQISNFQFPISIYPNPTPSNSSITFTYPSSGAAREIIINDVNGKEAARYTLPPWSTTQMVKLPQMASGVYVARLISNSEFQISNVKFVVE